MKAMSAQGGRKIRNPQTLLNKSENKFWKIHFWKKKENIVKASFTTIGRKDQDESTAQQESLKKITNNYTPGCRICWDRF